MKKVGWAELTDRIYARLGKAVSRQEIYDAVKVLNSEIIQLLLRDEQLSVKNLGTLAVRVHPGHRACDVNTGEQFHVDDTKTVRFYPHQQLLQLLEERKDRFFPA
jgi:nucleoid DNA-binding protein